MKGLFKEDLQVINVGLTSFGECVAREGGAVLQIEWSPPAQGNREIGKKLARLVNLPEVEEANQRAFKNYLAAQPILESVGTAKAVIPNMGERMIFINTGIAHHKAGIGQIGAGITRAPMACLAQAVFALADRLQ